MKEYKKYFAKEFKNLDDEDIKILGIGVFALFAPIFDEEYVDLLEQFSKDYEIDPHSSADRAIRSLVYGQFYSPESKMDVNELLDIVKEIRKKLEVKN